MQIQLNELLISLNKIYKSNLLKELQVSLKKIYKPYLLSKLTINQKGQKSMF